MPIKRKRRLIFIVFFVLGSFTSTGLAESGERNGQFNAWEHIKHDFGYLTAAPSRMDGVSYATLAALLGTAGYLYAEKDKIRDWLQSNRSDEGDDIAGAVKPIGNVYIAAGLASGIYLSGHLFKSDREKETGLMLAESLVYTGVLVGIGQFIFAEDRPDQGGGIHFFTTGGHGVSGHAAVAAALAGPINKQYLTIEGDDARPMRVMKYIGKVVVYGLPALTSWSRLNDDDHFAWNCLLGSVIGYTVGELIANAHRQTEESNLSLKPLIDRDSVGVLASYRF